MAKEFLAQVVARARTKGLTSDEHFTVDGRCWKHGRGEEFQRKDVKTPPPPDDPGNPTVNFHGEKRSNQTHESKTDPEQAGTQTQARKAKLSYSANLLVENRNGSIVNAEMFEANGRAERDAALVMLQPIPGTKPATAARTRDMTRRISWPTVAICGSRPTWRKTINGEAAASQRQEIRRAVSPQ